MITTKRTTRERRPLHFLPLVVFKIGALLLLRLIVLFLLCSLSGDSITPCCRLFVSGYYPRPLLNVPSFVHSPSSFVPALRSIFQIFKLSPSFIAGSGLAQC